MMKNPVNERGFLAAYLSSVIQSNDGCRKMADALLLKYGSLGRALERGSGELEAVVGAQGAAALKLLGAITSRRFTEGFKTGRAYSEEEICHYLKWLCFGREVECVYILFLDKGGRLLLTEKISEGTVNSSDIIPRRALEAAARLKSKAKGAILAHNHPGGTISVSESDIYATAVMKQALSGVGIELLRHYVVADGQAGLIN